MTLRYNRRKAISQIQPETTATPADCLLLAAAVLTQHGVVGSMT
jgi:hypothetical protein